MRPALAGRQRAVVRFWLLCKDFSLKLLQQVSELIHVPGVDFVGTVPSDIQPPTLFVGALPKNSQQPDLAVALLRFLSSAEAAGVITKAGLKPLAAR